MVTPLIVLPTLLCKRVARLFFLSLQSSSFDEPTMDTDKDGATEKKVYSRSAPFLYVNGYFLYFYSARVGNI